MQLFSSLEIYTFWSIFPLLYHSTFSHSSLSNSSQITSPFNNASFKLSSVSPSPSISRHSSFTSAPISLQPQASLYTAAYLPEMLTFHFLKGYASLPLTCQTHCLPVFIPELLDKEPVSHHSRRSFILFRSNFFFLVDTL